MQANELRVGNWVQVKHTGHYVQIGHRDIGYIIEGSKIHTIEGNTNDTGSREGYEVCRRVRDISKCKGFIRI